MRTIKNFINLFFLIIGHLSPRSCRKIVFGAWDGKSYSDNPKFLFEYLFDHPEWKIVWIGCKEEKESLPPLPAHASFAVRHTLKGLWHALTAKTWVFSHCPNDIALVAIYGRALLIDTCHGVALKKVGLQSVSQKRTRSSFDWFWKMIFARKAFLVMPSNIQGKNTLASYPKLFHEPILPFGSTSLDYIINNATNESLIQKLRTKYATIFNLPLDKKWIIYAPTFRLSKTENFSFQNLESPEKEKIHDRLQAINAIIIEKLHPSLITNDIKKNNNEIYSISGDKGRLIDPQELWLAADALISDYSSCVIPFYLQKKPVIHFAYDYDFYTKSDSGLIEDLVNIRFGAIVYTVDELCNMLCDLSMAVDQCGELAPSLIEYEKGTACERCATFIKAQLFQNNNQA